MLTEVERELITLAVDGELAPSQLPAFRRLIATSAEADTLYRQLKGDSTELKALPHVLAPTTLAPTVMAKVAQLPRASAASPRRRKPRREPRVGWVPYAVAASALIAVAAGSYWFASRQTQDDPNRVAQQVTLPKPSDDPARGSVAVPAETPREVVAAPRPFVPHPEVAVAPSAVVETAPVPHAPRIGRHAVGFGPTDDPEPFRVVEARLPLLAPLSGFNHDETRMKLREELAAGSAFRLDLFAKDTAAAAQVFVASAKAAGLTVTVDAVAAERMRRKLPSFWVVYVETLTAEDVEKLLVQLAADTKGDRAGSGLSAAHLVTPGPAEHKDLRDLFGVDMGLLKKPEAAPRSVASGTADQITKALQKEKQGVLVTYLPNAGRAAPTASKEVKQFLAQRTARTADAVPLMIVIRSGP
jgi:hypothetical protein